MVEAFLKFPKLILLKITSLRPNKSLLILSWPYLALIVAHTIWGINFAVAKLTLQEIPPMSLAFLRFALASVLLAPFLLIDRHSLKIDKKDLPKLAAIGVFMVTLNISFFYAGLSRTSITSASVLTMSIPVLSVLGGWWFLKEKIYTVNLVGIFAGLIGAMIIIGLPVMILEPQLDFQSLVGNFLIILASISWVIGAIISKEMSKKYSTLMITAIIFFIGFLTFLIPAVSEYFQNPSWPSQVTYLGILGLLFIALASSISAYFLFEWGLSKLGVMKADLFQYTEPIVAVTFGMAIFGEKLGFPFIIGSLLVLIGVYASTLIKDEHKHHKAHRT